MIQKQLNHLQISCCRCHRFSPELYFCLFLCLVLESRSIMARANISMNIIEEKRGHQTEDDDGHPLIKYYKATTLVPEKPLPLHHLLDRQPAAWAVRLNLYS